MEGSRPSTSGADTPPKKKARKWYQMSMKKEWFEDRELKSWLGMDPNDSSKCRCAPCNFTFKDPNKRTLLKHANTANHKTAVKASSGEKLTKFFQKKEQPNSSQAGKVARCEVIMAGFFSEHDIPFQVADHFYDMLRHAIPDSEILKTASAKRCKMSYLTVHGLASEAKQKVSSMLKGKKYSIMVDESTDVSVSQVLAVVVRVYDPKTQKVHDLLLDLVEPRDGTAEGIYDALMDALRVSGLNRCNIIGLGADNCATMMGANGGVRARLQAMVPGLFVMGCVCHSLALCAGHAAKKLPSWLEMFVKDVASYFSRSPKRRDALALMQEAVSLPCHQIPKLAATRWLSRGAVLHRLLEQWVALRLFFSSEAVSEEGKENRAADISARFQQPGTKHMLVFVHYVVKKVDMLNILFQSEEFQLHRLYRKMADGYRSLLSMYVKPQVFASARLHEVDPQDADICMPVHQIDLGGRCESLLLEEPLRDGERNLRLDALDFLQQLCVQMRQRFDMDPNGPMAQLKVLDPEVAALEASDARRPRSLAPVMVRFSHLVSEAERDELNDEWRDLPVAVATEEVSPQLTPTEFWAAISKVQNAVDQPRFPTLSGLAFKLMALPHSTAAVERIFSQVNLVKTAKTNRLKTETLKGRLLAKQMIGTAGETDGCCSFEPSPSLIKDVVSGGPHRRYVKSLQKAGVNMEAAGDAE